MNDHSFFKDLCLPRNVPLAHNSVGGDYALSKYLIIAMGIKHGAIVKIRINPNSTHIVIDTDSEFIYSADCVSF